MMKTTCRRNPVVQSGCAFNSASRLNVSNGPAVTALVVALWRFSPPAAGITINLIQAPDNLTDHPSFDPNLVKLAPIIQAAADYWENILQPWDW